MTPGKVWSDSRGEDIRKLLAVDDRLRWHLAC